MWHCGQKRSNDLGWSEKIIDLAGANFDILGVHNYVYEPEDFALGLQRIRDYLMRLREYIRGSAHSQVEIAVLEWNLARTYDWRAGLHAAGSLMMYEELSPGLSMTCPALLMRNTTDDPTWTSLDVPDLARSCFLVSGRSLCRAKAVSAALCRAASGERERDVSRPAQSESLLR